ncbi:MAG TPA: c-type cytochrome [Ramlibacter sp.]|nr:c-type cytochrome [Ramlibacter sp.]
MNQLLTTLLALSVAGATNLAFAQEAPATQASPKSLQAKVAMCVGCHGIVGYQASFPQVYKVPKIAGQNAKYIAAALHAYKTGDRKHPSMQSIADGLTEQDIADISVYYQDLGKADRKPLADKPSREPDAKVAALLQKAACASCHGANFSKPLDPSYPKIAGQHSDYLFVALKAYKAENNPDFGRSNGIMGAIAKQFSNNELKAIARYVSSLDTEIETKAEPKFR